MSKASDLARLLNADGEIQAADIEDGVVTAAKLASTLDLSGKTITNMNPSGIYLGGTAAANLLDDYEEGTWTPTVDYGTVSAGYADYVKIGNLVTLNFRLYNFSDTSTNSIIQIRGLPFNETSGRNAIGSAAGERTDYNAPVILLVSNFMRLNNGFGVSDYAQDLRYADINNGGDVDILGTITYMTSA